MKKIKLKKTFIIDEAVDGSPEKILVRKNEFDEHELMIIETNFYPNGEVINVVENLYTEDGQLQETIIHHIETEVEERLFYSYDKKLLKQVTHFQDDSISMNIFYSYNKDGRLISETEQEDDILVREITVDYTKKIKLENHFNETGNWEHQIETHFDDEEKTLVEIERDNSEFLTGESKTQNTYDESNNLINIKIYEKDVLTLNEDYFFNEAGVEIKSIGHDIETDETTRVIKEVDSKNRIIKHEEFFNDKLSLHSEKRYDENDQLIYEKNWTLFNDVGEEDLKELIFEYEYH